VRVRSEGIYQYIEGAHFSGGWGVAASKMAKALSSLGYSPISWPIEHR
jgi:hypothetical protein